MDIYLEEIRMVDGHYLGVFQSRASGNYENGDMI